MCPHVYAMRDESWIGERQTGHDEPADIPVGGLGEADDHEEQCHSAGKSGWEKGRVRENP